MSKLSESQKATINGLISEKLCVDLDKIQEDSKLQDDFNCDSLDHTELLMVLESEFDISIPDEDFDFGNETTVGSVYHIVESYLR